MYRTLGKKRLSERYWKHNGQLSHIEEATATENSGPFKNIPGIKLRNPNSAETFSTTLVKLVTNGMHYHYTF